ncbi:hypothetical protein EVA_12012 [gut metagenome]|uniref:Uncharacterized protein n=1 Tax=gut metagenome TaxID=749906 RepID=J9GDM5_9ZZZZ
MPIRLLSKMPIALDYRSYIRFGGVLAGVKNLPIVT